MTSLVMFTLTFKMFVGKRIAMSNTSHFNWTPEAQHSTCKLQKKVPTNDTVFVHFLIVKDIHVKECCRIFPYVAYVLTDINKVEFIFLFVSVKIVYKNIKATNRWHLRSILK